ncbi:MAG: CoB--CoM heterodisulfide reductase iron-sulfur subunit B family protein [Candidatus Zixiibacteriota bacterium]|nr:MAG: CoB--CoM heterodisulfide reductase iron-sulfur subunit B family protein [candidate division Zixibacteria bacterium]
MSISYYPGCTLKTKAKNLELSALAALTELGINVEELPRWNCCGAVFSLSDDDLIHIIAPVRDLIRVKEQGHDTVITLCSMCYNTLARANDLMKNDEEKRNTINMFMDEEPDYAGDVRVVHMLDYLRDDLGWDRLKEKIKIPLTGLKAGPYYGCTLLRPGEVAIDRPDKPTILSEFMTALGAEAIDFPMATDCCGSYQVLANPDAALKVSHDIISDAHRRGIEALVLACPLCDYNLGRKQYLMRDKFEGPPEMPVFYFTQLLAVALGLPAETCCFELNRSSAAELLRGRNFLQEVAA